MGACFQKLFSGQGAFLLAVYKGEGVCIFRFCYHQGLWLLQSMSRMSWNIAPLFSLWLHLIFTLNIVTIF